MIEDYYQKICADVVESEQEKIKQFHIKPLIGTTELENKFRSLGVWGMQNSERIFKAINDGIGFNILIGFRPSKFHFGHLTLAREIAYYISIGGIPIFFIAGYEANQSLSESETENLIDRFLRLVNFYSEIKLATKNVRIVYDRIDIQLLQLEEIVSDKIKVGKVFGLYGWDESISLKQIRNTSISVSAFLFSNYYFDQNPSIVLCDINQVTHVALTKIVATKLELEIPCFSYRVLLPSTTNPKERMSGKKQESCIAIDEEQESKNKKVKTSFTGGRKTVEEQKQIGGEPYKCCFFKYLELFVDRNEIKEIHSKCIDGSVSCSQCKNTNQKTITQQFI